MSRGLFLAKKTKPVSNLCVCTVDSYGVTAAVVRLFNGEGAVHTPVVLFSAGEKVTGETLGDVTVSLKKVLEQVRSHGGNPDSISCVIGEPWVATIPRHVMIEKSNEFKITKQIIDEALARDLRAAESYIRRDIPNAEDFSIVDVSESLFQVNGYRIDRMIGSAVPSLGILNSISVMPTDILNEIGTAISEVFHRDDVSFYAQHHAFARAISHEKILSLSIGGHATEWSIIDRGAILAMVSSAIGLADIEREIQHEFSIPKTLIDATMSFASDAGLVENEKDIYYRRIERCILSWLREIRLSFEQFQKQEDLLPKTIVLSSDASWTASLAPVVARELGSRVAVMSHLSESAGVVFAHDALIKTNALAQAVDYCVFRLDNK